MLTPYGISAEVSGEEQRFDIPHALPQQGNHVFLWWYRREVDGFYCWRFSWWRKEGYVCLHYFFSGWYPGTLILFIARLWYYPWCLHRPRSAFIVSGPGYPSQDDVWLTRPMPGGGNQVKWQHSSVTKPDPDSLPKVGHGDRWSPHWSRPSPGWRVRQHQQHWCRLWGYVDWPK